MNHNNPPFTLLPESLNPQLSKDLLPPEIELPKNFEKYFIEFEDDYEIMVSDKEEFLGVKLNDMHEEDELTYDMSSSEDSVIDKLDSIKLRNDSDTEIDNKNLENDVKENNLTNINDVESDEEPQPTKPKKYSHKIPTTWCPTDYTPTITLPFIQDLFQTQSFYLLSQSKSILVTAHTSSVKTTIVDYAILLSQLHHTKVIYTSPIKALSNQKYNEFKKYGPGIITGDVSLNTDSNILIVTTEILRNLLYAKNPILHNLEYVVFDEVHYINNKDRGVVWEECIIMLPSYVTLVMLSACIPNALEFGAWVGRVRETMVYVVETEKRAVPLEYYVCQDEEMKCIKKEIVKDKGTNIPSNESRKDKAAVTQSHGVSGNTIESGKITENIKTPLTRHESKTSNVKSKTPLINDKSKTNPAQKKVSTKKKDNPTYISNYVVKEKLTPSIFFCFSKKKCHDFAKKILKNHTTKNEKEEILDLITNKLDKKLPSSDRNLPQVEELKNLLINGIAIHLSGLLPILKETIEILFSRNLIKILIATETFSMGVNFPAKSVVFLSIKKGDNEGIRVLNPGEFMQMSGRAGRRNVDKKGIVIVNNDGMNLLKNIEFTVKNLISSSSSLGSRFKLTYNMILQLFRCKIKVEDILRRSFCEEKVQKNIFREMKHVVKLEKLYLEMKDRSVGGSEDYELGEYFLECKICCDLTQYIEESMNLYKENNRLIRCFLRENDKLKDFIFVLNDMSEFIVEKIGGDFIHGKRTIYKQNFDKNSFTDRMIGSYKKEYVLSAPNKDTAISNITNESVHFNQIFYIKRNDSIFLDYDLKDYQNVVKTNTVKAMFKALDGYICLKCPRINTHYKDMLKFMMIERKIKEIKYLFDDKSLTLFEDYFDKINLLVKNEYIDVKNNVLLKGRIACEIKTVDEIFLTEMIIANGFKDYEPEEIMAFISGFIVNESGEIDDNLNAKIRCSIINVMSSLLGCKQSEFNITFNELQYINNIEFKYFDGYVDAIYDWCKGNKLSEIVCRNNISEGILVRTILRLNEFCKEIKNVCILVNDMILNEKIDMAMKLMKRDIIHCSSLYLDE